MKEPGKHMGRGIRELIVRIGMSVEWKWKYCGTEKNNGDHDLAAKAW
jgi:hypothetical protein